MVLMLFLDQEPSCSGKPDGVVVCSSTFKNFINFAVFLRVEKCHLNAVFKKSNVPN
jgi:hypothetical protein